MGKFSVRDDPEADAVVERELEYVTSEIRKYFGDSLRALLLTGGFGRGEGSVLKTADSYRPLNDYDLTAVVHGRPFPKREDDDQLESLLQELARGVAVKQIDLNVSSPLKLSIPSPTVARYELKWGHRVLHGRLSFGIQALPARYLPLAEGTKYYRTRAGGLLLSRLMLDGEGDFTSENRFRLAWLEINKAFTAVGDSFLIARGRYHHSYQERLRRLKQATESEAFEASVGSHYIRAVSWKLRPEPDVWLTCGLNRLWFEACQALLRNFLRYEERRLGLSFEGAKDYLQRSLAGRSVVQRAYLRCRNLGTSEDSRENSRQRARFMALLQSWVRRDESLLRMAERGLGSTVESTDEDFGTRWCRQVRSLISAWHPKGIAQKLTQ